MSKKKDVAIIGGGASGLFCAIECARNGLRVDVYEQNNKVGKKILVSGNGRCNISHRSLDAKDYASCNPAFVSYALKEFGFDAFENYLKTHMGMLLDVLEDGRAYPWSYEAKSVVQLFHNYALSLGVCFYTEHKIDTITPLFHNYKNVVIATGSEAAPHLGGCSDGYNFAQEFGHTVLPTYPSLVQLHLRENYVKKMAGIKTDAHVTLLINRKKEHTLQGDILFTPYGISGLAILDISQHASEALLNHQEVAISLNLIPAMSMQKLSAHIHKTSQSLHYLTCKDLLCTLVPQKIATTLLETLHIDENTKNIDTKLAKKIANALTNWRFEVSQTHGFRHAEVSGGGVDTAEIDAKTFLSQKRENLYFCGEVLDVVGKRGGYNFAFAWASAYLAAQNIIKTTKTSQ